ncbi:Holliday junction branch migration protein RuvA [Alphaproteobacteria bacterium]|jgi:holliday junction DNA helicase RuvA|nr:Holliday junction branch migration protein RuvA [Alphaproteobacteria bacterium]
MIAKLRGKIDSTGIDWIIIDVAGVGYHCFCSSKTLSLMPEPGGDVSLLIETHVREDHIHLYAFHSVEEKECYKLLTSVQGVGSKVGLAILSVLTPQLLHQAILGQDKATVTQANGVGPKVAQRIITELKDKVGKLAFASSSGDTADVLAIEVGSFDGSAASDALSALENLGYRRADAVIVVNKIMVETGNQASVQQLIRQSLMELAR